MYLFQTHQHYSSITPLAYTVIVLVYMHNTSIQSKTELISPANSKEICTSKTIKTTPAIASPTPTPAPPPPTTTRTNDSTLYCFLLEELKA